MEVILAQILGGIALVLVSIGYFLKSKAKFLLVQIVANLFYAGAFFVLNAYVGAILTTISTLRCVYIYYAEKLQWKHTFQFILVFILCYVLVTIIFWQTPFDFMPLLTSTMFTIAFTIKDLQVMRYILIVPNVILVFYNILVGTYASALLDLLEVIVIVIAIIKFSKAKIKEKKTS